MFYPCMDFSFINELSGFLNMFIHLSIFGNQYHNLVMSPVEKETLTIFCCLMIWFPYGAIRNVHLQLSFAFPFSLLFSSQVYFIIFCLLDQKIIFLSSLLFSIPPHASTPFLFEVCGEKPHPAQSGVTFWIYTLAQLCFLSYLLSNTKC